ncbi:MAG TPA: TIGR03943 family protein [Spirochaetia bacterium]
MVEGALWSLVLLVYAGLLLYLVASDRLRELMHPRMTPFVIAGLVLLLLFAVNHVRGLIVGTAIPRARRVVAFLLLPLAAVPVALTSSSASLADEGRFSIGAVGAGPGGPFTAAGFSSAKKPASSIPTRGTIVLDEENYTAFYNAIYDDPQKYAGRTVTVTGFVYRGAPLTRRGEFVTAREMMWCCAVDVATIGFISRLSDGEAPPENEWVSVTGVLGVTDFVKPGSDGGSRVPYLAVTTLRHMETPDFTFVYPSF